MNSREMIKQRKHNRYKVKEGAFAVIKDNTHTLGQILDISRGGLAFKYIPDGEQLEGLCKLDIFFSGRGYRLKDIPFITVSDRAIENQNSFSSIRIRRCSVKFNDLKNKHKAQLNNFIHRHTEDKI